MPDETIQPQALDNDSAAATAVETAPERSAADPLTEPADWPVEDAAAAGRSAPFAPVATADAEHELSQMSLLDDVELDVKIELGRTQMYIEDVLRLGVGSVVELDKLAGDPVDVYINERLVARGEVLVLNDNLCVRINDIVSPNPELETQR